MTTIIQCIDHFNGEFFYLSNYYPCDIVFRSYGIFHSSEAIYQAMKHPKDIHMFNDLSADESKKLSKSLLLREDWEFIKNEIMYQAISAKFYQHPELAIKLINTGTAELIEGNTWGDTYWGVCEGKGFNHLGKLLMELRAELKNFEK